MSESKKMSQWFLWFVIVLLLMITSSLYCVPLIAQAMFIPPNPFADLYGWRMAIAGIGSAATWVWWFGRGQYYERRG